MNYRLSITRVGGLSSNKETKRMEIFEENERRSYPRNLALLHRYFSTNRDYVRLWESILDKFLQGKYNTLLFRIAIPTEPYTS